MLEHWALRQKRVRKALYAALVEARNLQHATCLRALTADEVNDYRRVGLGNPIAIVPNGVDPPRGITGDLFWELYPELAGRRIVLFLGRLHHKKGLHLLLQAWARVAKEADDVHLVIAGPDSVGALSSLQAMTGALGLRSCVTFTGMLSFQYKWSALRAASLFALPSYSEGFSVSVLEALGMGIPVIVTVPCHIPEVSAHTCGWVIEPQIERLEYALREFLEMQPEEAVRMGERGKDLVDRRFRWPVVGRQMAEVYDWLLGGSKPTNVEIA
jgi:glycosyltransferase involved in cell wall biosynthesis